MEPRARLVAGLPASRALLLNHHGLPMNTTALTTASPALRVLALSGSLRRTSLNSAMLDMAGTCAPAGMRVDRFQTMHELPLFNPDLEHLEPGPVAVLRMAIQAVDAVLIASPEYAHGMSGVMKNALDWMVSTSALVDKPVVIWNASPRATHALEAMRETLTVMSVRLISSATLSLLVANAPAGSAPANPDPRAMRASLTRLQAILSLTAA